MKKLLFALLILIILGFGILAKYLIDRSIIFTGFAAKNIASGVFIAKRTQESIEKLDIHFFPVTLATTKVDTINKIVTSNFFGFGKQTAIYREGVQFMNTHTLAHFNIIFILGFIPASS